MATRELQQLGGAPVRERQPLELDKSLFIELRGRDIGKEPCIKTQPPKGPVVHYYGKDTLDGKARSSLAGSRPSTADALKQLSLA